MTRPLLRIILLFAAPVLWLCADLAIAQTPPISVTSMANLRLLRPTQYTTVSLNGYYQSNGVGGGTFVYNGQASCTDNSGTIIQAVGGCYARVTTGLAPSVGWFGAKGGGVIAYDCTAATTSTAITCSTTSFTSADVGKTILVQWAGATLTGGVTRTFASTVASVTSTHVIQMASPATTTPSGPFGSTGFVVIAPDDSTAITAATTATIGVNNCLSFGQGQVYLTRSAIAFGGTANVPHCIVGQGATIVSHLSSTSTDNITLSGVQAVNNSIIPGLSFYPTTLSGFTFNCADTGQDCFVLGNNATAKFDHVIITNSYRNCYAIKPTTGWVDNLHADSVIMSNCGHHGEYLNLNQASSPYFNVSHMTSFEINNYGLNSCAILHVAGGPVCPWSGWSGGDKTTYNHQLGAAIYWINQGASGPPQWHVFDSFAIQPDSFTSGGHSFGAYFWGSNISPGHIYFANGRNAHLIEGAGNPGASLGVFSMDFRVSDIEGAGTPSYTSEVCIQAEDAAMGNAIQYFHATLNGPDDCTPGLSWGVINGASIGPTYVPGAPFSQHHFAGEAILGDDGTTVASTHGWPWMPSVAGKPTGVPGGSITGFVPFVYDSTNHQICAYDFGTSSWQPAGCH